jgi:predicted enzyme related to lactoylglutathione lyase
MANKHGDFIWYELMTSDADNARDFYSAVVGWDIEQKSDAPMDYRMISASDGPVAGLMPLTAEMQSGGARPCWMGYILVDDVDKSAAAVTTAGGSIHMPPWEIPGIGRMAFVANPQGVMFYIMKPMPPADNPDGESTSFAATEPMVGHCAWNELSTTEPDAAKAFYGSLFGWVKDGEMDMGPLGKYEFLKDAGGRFGLGAVMPKMPEMPMPFWTYYFRVPDIDAAVATTTQKGGLIIQEPIEIPGGDFSMVGMDPQGAGFALVGARK